MKNLTKTVDMDLVEEIGSNDGEYTSTFPISLVNELPKIGEKILVGNNYKVTVTNVEAYHGTLEFKDNKDFYTVFYKLENGLKLAKLVALI